MHVAASQHHELRRRRIRIGESGQALVEFAMVGLFLLTTAFGLIDFGRAIYDKEVMTNLTREGSNLASRGTSLTDTATAVVTGSAPLNLTSNGRVIVTAVTNVAGAFVVTGQVSQGGITVTSHVGTTVSGPATIPTAAQPQLGQTVYVTEVYYSYAPITPVGTLLSLAMPSTLYDVAYF
jgi:Flp pilus assembly protein TadG